MTVAIARYIARRRGEMARKRARSSLFLSLSLFLYRPGRLSAGRASDRKSDIIMARARNAVRRRRSTRRPLPTLARRTRAC